MSALLLILVTALLAGLLTGQVRRYALAHAVIDTPNARSSHRIPTPRGGGLAIVLAFFAALGVLWLNGQLADPLALALLGSGGLVALIGFIDDHRPLPARWRLLVHFVAAGWALLCLREQLPWPTATALAILVVTGWLLYLVWLLNLYNFMDGIDGLAGIEALCVGTGAALLHLLAGDTASMLPPALLAAAASGFLYWNFPPARIFMGDVGSGFVGIMLAILSLQALSIRPELGWVWLILLGVFIVDASLTLLRRLLRGEAVQRAHRRHAYQFAARHYRSHRAVSLVVAAINLGWLLPIASLVTLGQLNGMTGLLLAYLPLCLLALRFKAGAAHE